MKILESANALQELLNEHRNSGATIGFVPTMGYLHDGHLSLVEKAKSECDFVVVSIFVNPIQFGQNEDLDSYPRDLTRDQKLCESYGVDVVFFPSKYEMYPGGDVERISYPEIMNKLCGVFRPGHFEGVATVMNRFLTIVGECRCYMGSKDAQQLVVVNRLATERFPKNIIVACPLVREDTGLAMSSRNYYLSSEEVKTAPLIYHSLNKFVSLLSPGCNIPKALDTCVTFLSSVNFDVQYFSFVDAVSLEDVNEFRKGRFLLATASILGKTRLIDNFGIEINDDLTLKIDRGVNKSHKEVDLDDEV